MLHSSDVYGILKDNALSSDEKISKLRKLALDDLFSSESAAPDVMVQDDAMEHALSRELEGDAEAKGLPSKSVESLKPEVMRRLGAIVPGPEMDGYRLDRGTMTNTFFSCNIRTVMLQYSRPLDHEEDDMREYVRHYYRRKWDGKYEYIKCQE